MDTDSHYPVSNKHSTWAHRSQIPNPDKSVTMPYGAVVMIGEDVENPNKKSGVTEYYQSEIVVYDPKQVKIRYIVEIGMFCINFVPFSIFYF